MNPLKQFHNLPEDTKQNIIGYGACVLGLILIAGLVL